MPAVVPSMRCVYSSGVQGHGRLQVESVSHGSNCTLLLQYQHDSRASARRVDVDHQAQLAHQHVVQQSYVVVGVALVL